MMYLTSTFRCTAPHQILFQFFAKRQLSSITTARLPSMFLKQVSKNWFIKLVFPRRHVAFNNLLRRLSPAVGVVSISAVFRPLLETAHCRGRRRRLVDSATDETDAGATAVIDPPIPWKDIFWMLVPETLFLLASVASAILVAIINIKIPLLLGELVNLLADLRVTKNTEAIQRHALILGLYYGAQSILTFLYVSILSVVGERISSRLRTCLFDAILRQDIAFFDTHRSGEIIGRLGVDVQEFKSSLKQCISQGLRSLTQICGCVVSLYMTSMKMTVITVGALPCIVFFGTILGSGLRLLSRKAQAQMSHAIDLADEAVSNIRTVRAFAMEDSEHELFETELVKAKHLNQCLGAGIGAFQGLTNFAINGIVLAVLTGGGYLMVRDEISPGDLMAFLVTSQVIQRSLTQISLLFGQAVKGLSAGTRVFEYINHCPEMPKSGDNHISPEEFSGCVRFDNVSFAYPARPDHVVLSNFQLQLNAGKVTALVGASGSGKSTIAALLERFYDVNSGSVTIDNVDIRNLDSQWLRGDIIGFVSQEPVLFHTSVKENIRYGKPSASDTEVEEAAKMANAHDFITAFPHGYETLVGERGVTISGGQKQRIALARAFLKNPRILILDEATSALDTESEKLVHEAIERLEKGRTVLLIAHRLSTVQKADCIVVISNKKVGEIGNHFQLMKKRGLYYHLVLHQINMSLPPPVNEYKMH